MATRYFALVLGIAFLLVGVMAFIPGLVTENGHDLHVKGPGTGYLLGLFHVNILHNAIHLLFGVWGIVAWRSFDASRMYARVVAIAYGVFAVLGILPAPMNTVFGLVPIHGHDVWLHAVIAIAAAYFGWATVPQTRATTAEMR
jgi:hypothetical protein